MALSGRGDGELSTMIVKHKPEEIILFKSYFIFKL